MFRLLGFFALIAASVFLAMLLATTSGYVEIRVEDYLIQRSFAGFVVMFLVLLLLWGFVFHAIMRTLSIPSAIQRVNQANRSKRGHRALSDGLVAVASGDPDEAKKQARLASRFLDNPASSLLLTAQSAQLNGQNDAAERYFEAMLDDPSTRFLGLRGLIGKAIKAGDGERALGLLMEAKSLKPKAPWVLDLEYQLRLDRGELAAAETVAQTLKRLTAIEPAQGGQKVAVALLAQAVDDEKAGASDKALDKAARAAKASPGFFAAHSMVADVAMARGNKQRAVAALTKAWSLHPSGDVANRMLAAKGVSEGDFASKLAVSQLLSKSEPDHWASLAVRLDALIDAGRGAEASALLESWQNTDLEPELATLRQRVKDGEGHTTASDPNKALSFPLSAGFFACTACGTHYGQWHSHCGHCGSSSTIRYQSRVSAAVERGVSIAPVPLIEG